MKNIITFLIAIAILVVVFFIGKGCSTDDITQSAINELKAQIPPLLVQVDKLEKDKIVLAEIIDSLKKLPPQIDTKIVYLQAGVDSAIASDSLNAIVEYRKGLELLEIRTETTPKLTLREVGWGGLLFRELWGMRLKIPNLNETILIQGQLIAKQDTIISIKDDIIGFNSLTIASLELLVKEVEPSWLQSPTMILIYIALAFAGGLAVVL